MPERDHLPGAPICESKPIRYITLGPTVGPIIGPFFGPLFWPPLISYNKEAPKKGTKSLSYFGTADLARITPWNCRNILRKTSSGTPNPAGKRKMEPPQPSSSSWTWEEHLGMAILHMKLPTSDETGHTSGEQCNAWRWSGLHSKTPLDQQGELRHACPTRARTAV